MRRSSKDSRAKTRNSWSWKLFFWGTLAMFELRKKKKQTVSHRHAAKHGLLCCLLDQVSQQDFMQWFLQNERTEKGKWQQDSNTRLIQSLALNKSKLISNSKCFDTWNSNSQNPQTLFQASRKWRSSNTTRSGYFHLAWLGAVVVTPKDRSFRHDTK